MDEQAAGVLAGLIVADGNGAFGGFAGEEIESGQLENVVADALERGSGDVGDDPLDVGHCGLASEDSAGWDESGVRVVGKVDVADGVVAYGDAVPDEKEVDGDQVGVGAEFVAREDDVVDFGD